MMTPQRWLNLWEQTMRNGLEGCRGAPTIIFDSKGIITDVEGSLEFLKTHLEQAGVRGLTMPDQDEIDSAVRL
jgi:hypothetical protein